MRLRRVVEEGILPILGLQRAQAHHLEVHLLLTLVVVLYHDVLLTEELRLCPPLWRRPPAEPLRELGVELRKLLSGSLIPGGSVGLVEEGPAGFYLDAGVDVEGEELQARRAATITSESVLGVGVSRHRAGGLLRGTSRWYPCQRRGRAFAYGSCPALFAVAHCVLEELPLEVVNLAALAGDGRVEEGLVVEAAVDLLH